MALVFGFLALRSITQSPCALRLSSSVPRPSSWNIPIWDQIRAPAESGLPWEEAAKAGLLKERVAKRTKPSLTSMVRSELTSVPAWTCLELGGIRCTRGVRYNTSRIPRDFEEHWSPCLDLTGLKNRKDPAWHSCKKQTGLFLVFPNMLRYFKVTKEVHHLLVVPPEVNRCQR